MDTPALPTWLVPDRATTLALKRENLYTLYENTLDAVFDRMVEHNYSFYDAVRDDPRGLDPKHMLAWVHKDETRKMRYYEAQAIAAEGVAQDMLRIADGEDNVLEDVNRSALRISTRKWLLGVWNRKRFGETKQIEQNVTIDIGEAMAQAQQRVLASRGGDIIDVEPR